MRSGTGGPPVIAAYDSRWPRSAQRWLGRIRSSLCALDVDGTFTYDHIGSTSVPGLAAKAIIDLQVRVPELPEPASLDRALRATGYLPARGSRADSPGVGRDTPRGGADVPDRVWAKRLFHTQEPLQPTILHVRRLDSPWGLHTLWFRDWLRAHPDQRARYEGIKFQLAADHAEDADYDDYTRAKSEYFDEVQAAFEVWARRSA